MIKTTEEVVVHPLQIPALTRNKKVYFRFKTKEGKIRLFMQSGGK